MQTRSNLINIFRNLKLYNKIPNNFLLVGSDADFASIVPLLAQIIVCPQNNNCSSKCLFCNPIVNKSYEHFFILEPENNVIKIDDLNNLFNWSLYSNDQKQAKIYWIRNAETLTVSASNKLLKFLEANRPNYIGILTTNNLAQLLPTVRSRLQLFYYASINESYREESIKFQLKPKEIIILKQLDRGIYFIDDRFIQEKFLPTIKLIYSFQEAWEKGTLDDLYLWDRKKIIEPYFWFFLELLILFLNESWWEKTIMNPKNDLNDLYWLLSFTQKIWQRQQEFTLRIPKGGSPLSAFLFWLSELIEKNHRKKLNF